MLLARILFFVLTPVLNTKTRMQEKEADMFGLNASRQPDGFAQAAIHLGEYRKMRPGKLEESIFFDHPSGYNRIHSAMVWKGQNLDLFRTPSSPAAPNPSPACGKVGPEAAFRAGMIPGTRPPRTTVTRGDSQRVILPWISSLPIVLPPE